MKTRYIVLLLGLFSLFGAAPVLAHNYGSGGAYGGSPLTGGITIWGDSYGRIGYAGNLNLGFGYGYPALAYPAVPYYGYGPGYGYVPGYGHGYRYGRGHGRGYGRGHGRGHGGGHSRRGGRTH